MKALHKVSDVLRLGLHSLVVHKVRSALTVLGILFGVWSVIAMLAINEGLSYEAQKALRELGSNNIIIDAVKPPQESGKATEQARGALSYGLTRADVARLRQNVPGLVRCVVSHRTLKLAYLAGRTYTVSVISTEPSYAKVSRIDMLAGRFLTNFDMLRSRPHCVITAPLARKLFGYRNLAPIAPCSGSRRGGRRRQPRVDTADDR